MDEYINFANSIDISEKDDTADSTNYHAIRPDWESECKKLDVENEHLREVLEKNRIDNSALIQNINILKRENEKLRLIIRTVEAITGKPLINNLE